MNNDVLNTYKLKEYYYVLKPRSKKVGIPKLD